MRFTRMLVSGNSSSQSFAIVLVDLSLCKLLLRHDGDFVGAHVPISWQTKNG